MMNGDSDPTRKDSRTPRFTAPSRFDRYIQMYIYMYIHMQCARKPSAQASSWAQLSAQYIHAYVHAYTLRIFANSEYLHLNIVQDTVQERLRLNIAAIRMDTV